MSQQTQSQFSEAGRAPTPPSIPLTSETYVPATMPRFLSTFDMVIIFTLALFWISNVTGTVIGGASSFTYWGIGIIAFFIPCCLVCAQLGSMYPHEGSIYNWTYRAFSLFSRSTAAYMSFFVGTCVWLPGLLSIVSAAFVIVNCLQALNGAWLPASWQQGLVIIVVVVLTGMISMQPRQMVQNIIKVCFFTTMLLVALVVLSAVVWLLNGHHSATNFADLQGWQVNLDPATGNVGLLGTVVLALLGVTGPLMMAGEIKSTTRRALNMSFFWGALFVIASYVLTTLALLVVQGQNVALAASNPVQLVIATVDTGLGKFAGNVAAICMMLFFLVVAVLYNILYARILMSAGIDGRLPRLVVRLNPSRVPVNAIRAQTIISIVITLAIFFVIPMITFFGNPAELTAKAYFTTAAALLLVWAFSFIFPFVDLFLLYLRGSREEFNRTKVVPTPIILACCVVGPLVCLATIVDTLLFSFVPTLIPNNAWIVIVGSYALICVVLCAVGGMITSNESSFEQMRELS
jgi:glutamate:GABA antiporter